MNIDVHPPRKKMTVKTKKNSDILFDFWACQRPLTHHWGSGDVFVRIEKNLRKIDCAFGRTDQIPESCFAVDKNTGYDWIALPFTDNQFEFGYWDPPYDRMYKKEGMEIWRCCKSLAILHTHIFPIAWLKDAKRVAMIAVTMGPLKQIRCLQVFEKMIDDKKKKEEK
jgi:hypothetical protein